MSDKYVGFVDVGVLRALAPRDPSAPRGAPRRSWFRPQGRVIVDWFRGLETTELKGERFLRLYWYDGAFDPQDPRYAGQRRMFDAIAEVPGIQLRLGHLVERADQRNILQQKGVDTLLTLDLVRLAGRSVCATAILMINDRDFAEAIRAARDFGVRVLIATANKHKVARELKELADGLVTIPTEALGKMLPER